MKKKVTDLSRRGRGLACPGQRRRGDLFRRPRPALGRPRSSGVEERGEGCSVRSVSRSTPLKVRIQPDCPPA